MPSAQGLEAINNVSRLMEGFAITLDNVIEKAFEDWGATSTTKPAEPQPPERQMVLEAAEMPAALETAPSWREATEEETSTTGQDENDPPEGAAEGCGGARRR